MHTLSLRAFRSAALGLRKQPSLATTTGRLFHVSARVRAAAADDNDGSNKPDRENGNGENVDENIFGENAATANGESQGRKKPGSNGSLRSRTLRNRKPEELPPVPVPKAFLDNAIARFEDIRDGVGLDCIHEKDARVKLEDTLYQSPEWIWDELMTSIFDVTAWSEETLNEALGSLTEDPDHKPLHKKGDILAAAALWRAVLSVREAYGEEAADKLLEHNSISSSSDLLAALTYGKVLVGKDQSPIQHSQVKQILDATLNDSSLGESTVNWFEEDLIEEIIASVNADLIVPAPKNVKLAELRRPVTIFNMADYSGFTVSREIVRHVAARLEADVLHLKASDIAQIVGSYLGQDSVRAPGAMSQLGYKAAEINGRLKPHRATYEDGGYPEDIGAPYTIVMRDERLRKDNKRYISLMDDFLNGSARGKNDELWEDLKVNTALEELIHSADSESTEQRPIIVHVDDFNAMNTELDCGATVIGKIRKLVDGLWSDGRKIALIGSCSSKFAPRPYTTGLKELDLTERLINLRMVCLRLDTDQKARGFMAKTAAKVLQREMYEKKDFIKENERNIVRVLTSMIEPPSEATVMTTGEMGLSQIDLRKLPSSWTNGVLPLAKVYRIVTTMIGHSKNLTDVYDIKSIEKAAEMTKKLEQPVVKHHEASHTEDKSERRAPQDMFDARRLNPSEENYEERLESGLVNAEDIRTTFKDVHAPKETIESVKMLTTLSLIRPEAFSYGVLATERIPGCLLYGPPGTGKTLLAKAVAKESGANMIEISGASINNKYVGESEKSVRALFQLAKMKEPLVIFIDEADALLGARGRRDLGARRETINQFLREWDGMDKTKAFIMVATNRPFDLDEAVLRRLPRKLLIDLPLEQDRAAILRIHLKDEILDETTVSIEDIAKRTPLYSGSDLKNVCVAAAMAAVKEELELEEQQTKEGQEESSNNSNTTSPKRRILAGRHFDKALQEIGASVSEDMATLTAIRKFDEKYGDNVGGAGGRRRKRKGMGFELAADAAAANDADAEARGARVRSDR
ncbi:AAA-domain-containing protein [Hypoxylon trugodes]|uniref:AAA-domain-containing protein n=1 Tax=Hypoxylon trugodes TaxID=326681 RepID=UPI00219F4C4C|nr:AAA-domain-containing protein [Hypoxylon trugodes]KAI1388504.1 AAA-domain-containing protein [Hypoxylon trugodes]